MRSDLRRSGLLTNLWLVFRCPASHLSPMMKNLMTQNPKARRPLLLGVTLLSLLALNACAGNGTTDGGQTELELPRFDQDTIGSE